MSKNGFYIKRIIIKGDGKKNVDLEFQNGLNLIAGASDTGKTYIFELIDYMMGATDEPKDILESEGYEHVFMEISDYNNNLFTLRRNLRNKKDIILYECSYNSVYDHTPIIMESKHNEKKDNNISKLLLKLSGINYSKVIVNAAGKSQNFSFRSIINLIMLSEEQVISKKSILEGFEGYSGMTKHKNIFKTIITGVEDKVDGGNEDKKQSKITIDAKIEMVDQIITQYYNDIQELRGQSKDAYISDIEKNINQIRNLINDKQDIINNLEDKTEILISREKALIEEKNYNTIIIKRFKLLKQNYLSDLQRLSFIEDANFYINQLENVTCPACNSNIDSLESINHEVLQQVIEVEMNKLKNQIKELEITIKNLVKKNKYLDQKYNEINYEIKEYSSKIETELKPILKLKFEDLEKLLDNQSIAQNIIHLENQLKYIEKERKVLIDQKKNLSVNSTFKHELSEINISDMCKEVGSILEKCKLFKVADVEFDKKNYDFIINKKKKESFGKGYRSIINSAIILAIMQYTTTRNLPHPKLVILDSPLTTYKGKDKDSREDNDKISEEVKYAFYDFISKKYIDKQVIILDNVDPKEETIPNINYYYFSKNKHKGRYGLYPI